MYIGISNGIFLEPWKYVYFESNSKALREI